MLRQFIKTTMSSRLYLLSDAPRLAAGKPGTDTLDVSAETLRKYEEVITRFIEYCGDDVPISSVTRQQYANFHDWLATRGTLAVTTNGYRRRIRAIWNRLNANGIKVCNIDGITREEPEPRRTSNAISDEQLARIIQIASIRDAAIVMLCVRSGIRRQTIPRLRIADTKIWQNADGNYRLVSRIPREKTSAPRLIMADHDAALLIKAWLAVRQHQQSIWLFNATHNGGQLSINTVSSIFTSLRRKCNIPGWVNVSPHALRHRFAQDMLADEHDAKVVSQWMGISVDTMLKVYAHRSEKQLVVERFKDGDLPDDVLW